MPIRGELRTTGGNTFERRAASMGPKNWLITVMNDADLLVILLFCVLGLWATMFMMHYFSDFDAMREAIEQFG